MKKPRTLAYWARHKRLKCGCGGYEFPHRKKGGGCYHNPNELNALLCRARRQGMRKEEIDELVMDHQSSVWESESPAYVGTECPF